MRLQRQINKLNEEVSQLGNAIMYLERKFVLTAFSGKKKEKRVYIF